MVVKTFTIRLEEEEAEKLEALKKLVQQNTDNGAIKHLLRNFGELNKRYVAEMNAKSEAQNRYNTLKQNVELYFSSFDEIKKTLSNRPE